MPSVLRMNNIVIIGAGPGIGASVARRFAGENFRVGLIARSEATLRPLAEELSGMGVPVWTETADAADEEQLSDALARVEKAQGLPEVLMYNAAVIRPDVAGELSRSELTDTFKVNVLGGLDAGTTVGARMAERGNGTIVFTGGMPNAFPPMTSLSLGKAALRTVAQLLAEDLGPRGVHVATVTVSGGPVARGGQWDPDEIAQHFWELHQQSRGDWQHEVVH